MNRAHITAAAATLALLILLLAATIMTQGVMDHLPFLHSQRAGWTAAPPAYQIVDQRPWKTAETLAPLAVSAEELAFAREAERLADHEVDQNFSQSLRQASAEPRQLTGEALALQQRVVQLQQTVKDDQKQLHALTTGLGPAPAAGSTSAPQDDSLTVAQQQLVFDNEELGDAIDDLARVSGDQRSKIEEERAAREAAMKKYDASALAKEGDAAVVVASNAQTLASQLSEWWAQRNRKKLINEAEQLARADVAALTGDYARLKPLADSADAAAARDGAESAANRVQDLERRSAQEIILSILKDRLSAQKQLVALYVRWDAQVELQHKMFLHLILRSLTAIAAIVLLTILVGWGLQETFARFSRDRRQQQTLRVVLNLGTQIFGLLLVLLVVFGVPRQTPTILGLATAGLTVVFQDFILAFCGWFVLMGRNGIRPGDWVEIDGVGGEAEQVGVFRTWLLETGNWTANGHPTGRRVSFLNGYAIHGKFFNFSTAGQWMWDEIQVTIPPDTKAYPFIDKIREAAMRVTETDANMAEQEWKRVTHEQGAPQFSATPSVDMRPDGANVQVVVRYITRAGKRLETRTQLFATVVELLVGARDASEVPPAGA